MALLFNSGGGGGGGGQSGPALGEARRFCGARSMERREAGAARVLTCAVSNGVHRSGVKSSALPTSFRAIITEREAATFAPHLRVLATAIVNEPVHRPPYAEPLQLASKQGVQHADERDYSTGTVRKCCLTLSGRRPSRRWGCRRTITHASLGERAEATEPIGPLATAGSPCRTPPVRRCRRQAEERAPGSARDGTPLTAH
ncbi:hypothetical protein SKAU_G00068280 [Synaphobranchus kaupii]|uniref:Uncharacterized protein n=1 Tax=Synaphobranchus kaupii TaxID=118154 RepID=A0A9Q1JB20_SYNKA|nr:hypothetical protein SKAU_G00068280 [Synaphobranchus kaupii]